MKRLLVGFLSLCVVLGFGATAMAAFDIRTAITSEPITGTTNMCEKYGAVTWTFSTGTKIYDGDWMIFDLPRNVDLCQSFDFVVLGSANPAGTGVPNNLAVVAPASSRPGTLGTTAAADGTAVILGPWKVIDMGTNGIADGITVSGTNGLLVRVTGTAGGRRITVSFYDSEDNTNLDAAANKNGNTELLVKNDTQLTLTLFDGEPWNGVVTIKNPLGLYVAVKDNNSPKNGIYGEVANDSLQNVTTGNIWDNFICAKMNADWNEGDRVNVSFDSGGKSGDDFLTFQGQREIAHIIGATSVTLEACSKRDLCGYMSLAGGQGANCIYEYDAPGGGAYCADTTGKVFNIGAGRGGNLAILQMQSGFGTTSDVWYVELEIVSGDGTYFSAVPAMPRAYNATNANDLCGGVGGDQVITTKAPGTWRAITRSGAAATGWGNGVGCSTVAAGAQVSRLISPMFTVANPNLVNRLALDLPAFVYVPSLLTNGSVATVRVKLFKAPCGQIFSADRCVANYVSTCAAAQPTTTLLYPYAVDLSGKGGWWFGMSFCNPSNVSGTAVITAYEDDGDTGTFTTPEVKAGGMVTLGAADLLASLTPAATNKGKLGDARCHIIVKCNFGFAGGFGMMGNGSDSTGYSANGIAGNAAGDWIR